MVFMDDKHTQCDDKAALFKTLREDLERIKLTLDTSSMGLVRLSGDIKAEVIEGNTRASLAHLPGTNKWAQVIWANVSTATQDSKNVGRSLSVYSTTKIQYISTV